MSADLGLALVSDPEGDHSADLVFIHGLGGHRSRTFTNKHSEFWPPWLNQAIPKVRVWTYGYNAKAILGSEDDLSLHATKLLRALVADNVGRKKGKSSNRDRPVRPVIFLAHSLGGIVVKKAMVIASSPGQSWSYLFSTSPAVIFMGTPHRGSYWAQRLFMATALSQAFLPRSEFLHVLRDRSSMLATLAEQFNSVWGKKQVLCFRETARVGGIGMIVEPKYAVTNCRKEVVIDVVNCDHHQICKPESMQSPLFLSMVKHVELFLKSSGPPSPGLKPTRTKSNERHKDHSAAKPVEKSRPGGKAKSARKEKSKGRTKERTRPVEKVIAVENIRPVISFNPPKPPRAPRNVLVKARPLPKPPKSQPTSQSPSQSASVRSLPIRAPSEPPPPPPPPTRSHSAPGAKKSEPRLGLLLRYLAGC
ncbi:unnamed protein product [Tuber aestivum]|uniref:AB hydrolase-1 domain-containing protein n=1 Tax=Tuber aestivum TaxID=59557 RepID=A0A292Q1Z4_9PEZI|nr:unnamed protein product [Tuber aestivum]